MKGFRYFTFAYLFFVYTLAAIDPTVTVKVPMRDGFELSTDLYLPESEAKNLPCILLRLPGGRAAEPWKSYAALSALGYAVAIQDTRSSIDPEGKTLPYLSDGWLQHQDGYDAVEWLAKSEYTNGKIGTLGFSAAGLTQILMAPSAPPSLTCQYIGVAPPSMHQYAIFPGGQLLKNQVEGWLGMYAKDPAVLAQVCEQPSYNEFWQCLDANKVAHLVKVPGFHYGGWYDIFSQGTLDAFTERQNQGGMGAKGTQKLVMGPWTHQYHLTKLGDFEVPKNGMQPPFEMSPNRWFEHYLKGKANGINEIAAVTYYVMGPFNGESSSGNVWKSSDVWPVPCTYTNFYLRENGKLSTSLPTCEKTLFSYAYDPKDLIPTIGGNNLFLESGPKDQRAIEERKDVITFTSEALEEELEITGRVKAKLFFTSDKQDTDIVARLTDVYPDGRSILIADGIYRTGAFPSSKKEGEIQEIEVDLWSTSLVFAKGHKIRITLCSSNYPKFEKNLNIGYEAEKAKDGNKEGVVAKNTFIVSKDHPSAIVLPVIK